MQVLARELSFQLTDAGFSVLHDGRRRQFGHEDVVGLRTKARCEPTPAGDVRLSESLEIHLRDVDGTNFRLDLDTTRDPLGNDPFDSFRDRLVEQLVDRAWTQMQRGETVGGDDWSLSLMYFTELRSGTSCFLEQIEGVSWEGDELCVWHEDLDQPFARLDRAGENAEVLAALVARVTGTRTITAPRRSTPPTGLGPMLQLLQFRNPDVLSPRALALAVSLTIVFLPLFVSLTTLGYAILLGSVFFLAGQPLLRGRIESLGCYQHGFVWSDESDERLILSSQLYRMTETLLPETRSMPPSGFTGYDPSTTRATKQLLLTAERDASQTIVFPFDEAAEQQDAYARVRDHAAGVIAQRMQQQLYHEGMVSWTPDVTITCHGLLHEAAPADLARRVGWGKITGWSLDKYSLKVTCADGGELRIRRSQPNFYPGLRLLREQGYLDAAGLETMVIDQA